MPAISVVIPTYERLDVLPEVLAGLAAQRGAPDFEVVVVDDGSRDATPDFLARYAGPLALAVLRQENRGPAAARNAGVAAARGELVAFLGDDTVPEPGWLAAHVAAHAARRERAPLAVLGYTGWHPRMRTTPFLRYINEHGLQFGYALIDEPEKVPFNFFYTSNVSLPRALLLAEPFDLRFPHAAWEDVELSYRLHARGLTMVYEPRARTAHLHPTDFARFCGRQEKAGESAVVFYRLHPELGGFLGLSEQGPPPLPPLRSQRRRELVVRALQNIPVRTPTLWDDTLRHYYIRGLRRGWERMGGVPHEETKDHGQPEVSDEREEWAGDRGGHVRVADRRAANGAGGPRGVHAE
ncbi:MAG TPA: glycosyltransferase [Thermoanaerobaculia bacterium]|nr:glycosyltransferase [Thermoanaerobaculia bacterium]